MRASADIKVETSPSFDRTWYRAQTVLQTLLALVILAGVMGAFGGGWFSTAVTTVGPFKVTYERFARKTVPFQVTVQPIGEISARSIQITFDKQLMDKIGVVRSIPVALSSRQTLAGVEFDFAPSSTPGITMSLQANKAGVFMWKLGLDGVGETSLFQIIYP